VNVETARCDEDGVSEHMYETAIYIHDKHLAYWLLLHKSTQAQQKKKQVEHRNPSSKRPTTDRLTPNEFRLQ
jgi:hypothetical protein